MQSKGICCSQGIPPARVTPDYDEKGFCKDYLTQKILTSARRLTG
jgi:hypothetical protein